ncbi:hypothetical protein CYD30_15410 [Kosakonia cowanii]|nr:hypothetical protein CYD30_15410 [Kosakonia cowanii]
MVNSFVISCFNVAFIIRGASEQGNKGNEISFSEKRKTAGMGMKPQERCRARTPCTVCDQ